MGEGSDIRDPLVGSVIGSYRVERLLGEGGMGAVYELVHPGIHKRLALKVLHEEYAQRADIVARFFDEARAVNLIAHPNIVDVIDFNRLPDGRPYLMMEFLEGESLGEHLARSGPMPPEEVAAVVGELCSALGAAHAAGIVHRDLKPDNIFLCARPGRKRQVKVLDFGIAKLRSDLRGSPDGDTQTGVVLGTPTYMSPEQASGRTGSVDHRTDVYALGVITFQMLTGRTPFSGQTFAELIVKHLNEPPPSLSTVRRDLAAGWDEVVGRALAKTPAERFGSMAELAAATQRAATGAPAEPPRRRQALLWAGGAAAAVAVVGLVVAVVAAGGGGSSRADPGLVIAPAADAAAAASEAEVAATVPAPEPPPPADAAPAASAAADEPEPAPEPDETEDRDRRRRRERAERRRERERQRADERERDREAADETGTGAVRITASPWAFVSIDGEKVGQTPVTRELAAGRHQVELQNPELGRSERRRVTVRAGKTTPLHVDLR